VVQRDLLLVPVMFVLVPAVMLKLFEMWQYAIIPNLLTGRERADRFHDLLRSAGAPEAARWFRSSGYRPFQLTNAILSRVPDARRPLFRLLISWPALTIGVGAALAAAQTQAMRMALSGMLVFLLITRVAHRAAARVFLGVADNVTLDDAPGDASPNLSRIAAGAIKCILLDIGTIILAFSVCFRTLDRVDPAALAPASLSATRLDAFYFSIATAATGSTGEIYALSHLAKIVVISETLAIWSLVLMVVLHYGITLIEFESVAIRGNGAGDPIAPPARPIEVQLAATGPPPGPPVEWTEFIIGAIQFLLAILLVVLVIHYAWQQWIGSEIGVAALLTDQAKEDIEHLLGFFLLIIATLELAQTLLSKRIEKLLDVMVYVIARKALVKVDDMLHVLYAVIAIALLFILMTQYERRPGWLERMSASIIRRWKPERPTVGANVGRTARDGDS
jgi:hypothetical protein